MKNFFVKDTILVIILLAIACACYLPLMPHGMTMMAYTALVVLFTFFALFVWHQKVTDEREERHRSIAAQAAFFAGGFVLIAAIAYQGLRHEVVDPWILMAFSAMLLGRIIGRWWAQRYC